MATTRAKPWDPGKPHKTDFSGHYFSTGGREVIRMSTHGMDGVIANLHSLNSGVREACQEITERSMNRLAELARQRVPVREGRLRESITERLSPGKLAFEVFCDPEVFARDGKPYYAPHVNFGTVFQAANPFLTSSAEEVFPEYETEIQQAVRDRITRTTR